MPSKLNLNEADFTIPFSVTKTTHGSPHVLLHLIEHADDALARAINLPIKVEA